MANGEHLREIPKNLRSLDAPPPPVIKGKPGPVRPPKVIRSVRTEVPNLGAQLLSLNNSLFRKFVDAMEASTAENDDPFAFLPTNDEHSESQE